MFARFAAAIAAMVAVVAASNFLVQFPVQLRLGPLNLADLLTWGAFTYPIAFLVTDLTNRHFGPQGARLVVVAGFVVAVALSVWLATPRIAIASGTAFLVAQFLDISIFDRLRARPWWQAPLFSSLVSSALDTLIFFSLAFAAPFSVLDTASRPRRRLAGLSGAAPGRGAPGRALDVAGRRRFPGQAHAGRAVPRPLRGAAPAARRPHRPPGGGVAERLRSGCPLAGGQRPRPRYVPPCANGFSGTASRMAKMLPSVSLKVSR